MAVDLDEPALIELEPDAVRAQARGIRNPPDGDDQALALKLPFAAPFCRIFDRYALRAGADAGDRRAQYDVEALLLREYLPGFLGHRVVSSGQERLQRLQDRDLSAEPAPHAAQLEPDHAGAYHAQPFRYVGNRQRSGIVEHELIVERDFRAVHRQGTRVGSGRDNDVPGRERLRVVALDSDLPAARLPACECAAAVEECHLVF